MAIDAATVRKVAKLARLREDESRLEPLAREISSILGWIEQLNEVDVEGVEPMASAVAARLPMREDVVIEDVGRDTAIDQQQPGDRDAISRPVW